MNIQFELKRFLWVTLGTVIFSLGISFFVIPAALIPGGLTGISLLIQYGLSQINIGFNLGILVVILNIPVMIIGIRGISRTFVYYSIYSIVLQGFLIGIFENQDNLFGQDILASSLFGGLSIGLGASIALKSGASLGGMDIISQYISLKKHISVGYVSIMVNGLILMLALLIFDTPIAFYTLLTLFIANLIIDQLHTAYKRVRLDIVTTQGDTVKTALINQFIRGITVFHGTGAYTGQPRQVLWMVTQSHEVYDIKKIVLDMDPDAFITMTPIRHLSGKFHRVIMK